MIQRIAWLVAQGVLVEWYLASEASDRQVIFLFVAALSFPAGLLVPWLVVPIATRMDDTREVWTAVNIVVWFGTVVAGYGQWFVLLPGLRAARAAKRWKRHAGQLGGPGNPWPRD